MPPVTRAPDAIELSLNACRERYLANLEALYAADAALALELEAVSFAACPDLEPTADGAATARLLSDDNQPIYIHSRRRPLAEAASLISAQTVQRNERAATDAGPTGDDADDPGDATVVLCGSGLGYHILECARMQQPPLVVVFEPDLALLKAAFCVSDFSRLLRTGSLAFLARPDIQEVRRKLESRTTSLMLGTRLITLPHAQRCQAAQHRAFRACMADLVVYARTQFVTVLRNSQITFRNIANNLPHYVTNPGVEALSARAKGFPAIVVGAGPSLSRHLQALRQIQDKAVIIAVQTVFGPLRRFGIEPHFVTSLDYHEISKNYFVDAAAARNHQGAATGPDHEAILVAEPKVTWHVPDAFSGRKHMLRSLVAEELLRGCHVPRAALPAGSTVAHLAFYLAQHLGCDPILLVGLDLAFSDGLYYTPGTPVETLWDVELGRFNTVEMKQWERVARMRPILRQVADLHGEPIYTDETFFTYIQQFTGDIQRSQARVINVGERGAQLGNAETMPLAAAIQQFCTRPLSADWLSAPTHAATDSGEQLRCARTALATIADEVDTVRDLAARTREKIEQLVHLLDNPVRFNSIVAEVDALRLEMERHERIYRLAVSVSPIAELRRIQADRAFEEDDQSIDDPATARRRLRRDARFVADFLAGCDFLARTLAEARQRLEAEQES